MLCGVVCIKAKQQLIFLPLAEAQSVLFIWVKDFDNAIDCIKLFQSQNSTQTFFKPEQKQTWHTKRIKFKGPAKRDIKLNSSLRYVNFITF